MPEADDLLLLKRDAFGRVERVRVGDAALLRRVPCGSRIPGSAWLARALARRERRALARLAGLDGIPRLGAASGEATLREFLEGERLDRAGRPRDDYFPRLEALLGRVHARGVAHNDLAKEANILMRPDGSPALIDFQLSVLRPARGGRIAEILFRGMVREDLRHVAKQKALRRPDLLSEVDRRLLARRSLAARLWRRLAKPVYRFVTRRILRTADREGLGPRGAV